MCYQFKTIQILTKPFFLLLSLLFLFNPALQADDHKNIAYLVSDQRVPFWDIMARGIQSKGSELGYQVNIYSAENTKKTELQNTIKALKNNVDGLIISPINSSTSVTILQLAKKAGVPVVISDIGTDSGEYVSYISSNNKQGAYEIGKVLISKMESQGRLDGSVGIVAIPQERANGQARTAGFMQAMKEAGITSGDIRQQVDFSYKETYEHSKDLIHSLPDIKAIWLQGSDRYQGALDAIRDSGKSNEILLICFDAEPIFLDLIPQGVLVGAAMQQPFLMGEISVSTLDHHLNGQTVEKNLQLPILAISKLNMEEKLPIIYRNVLGMRQAK